MTGDLGWQFRNREFIFYKRSESKEGSADAGIKAFPGVERFRFHKELNMRKK